MQLSKNELASIIKILNARYKSAFKKSMSLDSKKKLAAKLTKAHEEKRLISSFSKLGTLNYFIEFNKLFMGEYSEYVFDVENCYCINLSTTRKQFYKKIQNASLEMKKTEKVKRMLIQVSYDDAISKKHFSTDGELTYLELVGQTKKGLKALDSSSLKESGLHLEKLQKQDIKKLAKLDREAHLADKSSRMRKIFMRPNGEEKLIKFYNALLRNKGCIVIKEGNTPAGSIGFFVDKKNKHGLIACIFVSNDFQGRGISKLLYKSLLMEFSKKKLDYYIGSTTTYNVLGSAKTMGRLESKSAYLLKI